MPKVVKGKTGSRPDKNKDKPIHPYSRKAKKLGKKAQHYQKVEDSKNARVAKLEFVAEKLRWFQDILDDRECYTREDITYLVAQYRNRFEDELEQINIVQSVGKRQTQSRQHASREAAIKITKENERNQYESSGIEVPNIIDKKHLEIFRKWKGELNMIQNLKLIKVSSHRISGVQGLSEQIKPAANDAVLDDDNDDDDEDNERMSDGDSGD